MANDEHVALLKQGVAAWNAWREGNPHISPDLTNANLSRADLIGAWLEKARAACPAELPAPTMWTSRPWVLGASLRDAP